MLSGPSGSSSRPGKLISSRILLRLSFIVSRTRPSVRERLAERLGICGSGEPGLGTSRSEGEELLKGSEARSKGSELRSSRGESKRGMLFSGVVLSSISPRESGRGPKAPWGIRTGLKSSPPTLAGGVSLHDSGVLGRTDLLGVEEMGSVSLTGVLKGPPSSWGQPSWEKGSEDSARNGGSMALRDVLGPSEKTSSGSSRQGGCRCCFLRDRFISLCSLRLITSISETQRAGDLSPLKDFFDRGVGEQDESSQDTDDSSLTDRHGEGHSSKGGLSTLIGLTKCGVSSPGWIASSLID